MKYCFIICFGIFSAIVIVQGQVTIQSVKGTSFPDKLAASEFNEITFTSHNHSALPSDRKASPANEQRKTAFRQNEFTDTYTVTSTDNEGAGSLRQAILDANANAGLDLINFDIPGNEFHWIVLVSALPQISDPVVIDGTSQPGVTGNILIGLNGTYAGLSANGLSITAGNCMITGLAIQDFGGNGIHTEQNGGNDITYNSIAGNGGDGIHLMAPSDTLRSNTIVSNSGSGVEISGISTGNLVDNNFIGTDGAIALANSGNGVTVRSADNTLSNNLISGNTLNGIHITGMDATGNLLAANAIGTNNLYNAAIANGMNGILIESADNTVGGSDIAANLTSGNGENGIKITGSNATGNLLQGNFVGTDATGTLAVGNAANGIEVLNATNTIIRRNLVSGNGSGIKSAKKKDSNTNLNQFTNSGIYIQNASGTEMVDLLIGTDISGDSPLGNQGNGMSVEGGQNLVIGGRGNKRLYIGSNAGAGVKLQNVSDAIVTGNIGTGFEDDNIANSGTGIDIIGGENIRIEYSDVSNNGGGAVSTTGEVIITGSDFNNYTSPIIVLNTDNCQVNDNEFSNGDKAIVVESGIGNEFLGNSFMNIGFPIDLGGDGVTPNDPNDADTGPNNLLNTPVDIDIIIEGGRIHLSGDIDISNPEDAVIEILFSESPLAEMIWNPAGTVMPDADGNWTFNVPFDFEPGLYFRAFATTDDGTSESSQQHIKSQYFSSANNSHAANNLHPISMLTGELYSTADPDLYLDGPMPLFFSRYYASMLRRDGIASNGLGVNWLHNFDWKLDRSGERIVVSTSQGRIIQFLHTGGGWHLQGKQNIPFQLVESGSKFILADPRDNHLYVFDNESKLTQIKDDKGNTHSLSYSNETIRSVSSNQGHTLTFEYDTVNHLTSVSDGSRTIEFGYTDNHLISFTDADDQMTVYQYDTVQEISGLMTSEIEPNGNTIISQTYDSLGRVVSQTDGNGNVHTIEYHPSSGAVSKSLSGTLFSNSTQTVLTDPRGLTREFIHNQQGENISFRDKAGISSNYEYTDGFLTEITDRLGTITTYYYHPPSGKISAINNPDGTSLLFAYTAIPAEGIDLYYLSAITYPDGSSENFSYDESGNLTAYSDRESSVWSYTYNEHGQILTSTNPEGGVTTFTYNEHGLPVTLEDAAGHIRTFTYDDLYRPITITYSDSTSRSFTWNNRDLLISWTDAGGNTTDFNYDANGNLVRGTDRLGNQWLLDYDDMNQMVGATDPQSQSANFAYDELNRLISITNRNGHTTTYSYDAVGRLISVTDPEGNTVQSDFDAEGIIESITDPLGNTTTFVSDDMGRITAVATPLGNTTNLTRDIMGRITTVQDPLNQSTQITYNDLGFPADIRLATAASSQLQRNGLGQITQTTDPNGNARTFTRDAMGLVTSFSDPLGNTVHYSYDRRNRMAQFALPDGLGTAILGYDDNNNLTSIEYSDGVSLNYQYDALNQLTQAGSIEFIYDTRGNLTQNNGLTITRDAEGRMTGLEVVQGKTVSYEYDKSNRLTKISDWLGGETSFMYDAAGRLKEITRPNGVKTTYTYNAENHVTAIVNITGQNDTLAAIHLTRDANGQIVASDRTVPAQPGLTEESRSHQFDAASQISDYTYDALGRLLTDDQRSFTWDPASRLTSYSHEGKTVSFTYDDLGNRTSRTSDGTTRTYRWNYALALPSVSSIQENGSDMHYYIHTPGGQLLYSIGAMDGSQRYYHFDEMGNTLFLTDDNARIIASYAYSPFGKLLAQTGDADNPFTFRGQFGVLREKGDLFYMRARYYDAASGRFLSRDPIRSVNPRSTNPYQYAAANPLKFIDPRGLQVEYSGHIRTRYIIDKARYSRLSIEGVVVGVMDRGIWPEQPSNSGNNLGLEIYDPGLASHLLRESGYTDLDDIWNVPTAYEEDPHRNAFLHPKNGLASKLIDSGHRERSTYFGWGIPASDIKPENFISKHKLIIKQSLTNLDKAFLPVPRPGIKQIIFFEPDFQGFKPGVPENGKNEPDNKPTPSIMNEMDPILKIL